MPKQLAYSPDGRWIASAASGSRVHLIDARTGETKLSYSLKNPSLIGFAFSPDSQSLALIDQFTVTVWDTKQGKQLRHSPDVFNRDSGSLNSFASSPDHEWLVSMNLRQEILVTKWDQMEPSHRIPFRSQSPVLAIGKRREWVAAADSNSPVIHVWKAPKFDTPTEWKSSESPVRALVSSRDGEILYAGRHDGTLQAWSIKGGRDESQFLRETSSILSLVVSQDGKLLAVITGNAVSLYDTATGRALHKIDWNGHFPTQKFALSPDNTTLAMGAIGRPIELWDVKTGKAVYRQPPALENLFSTKDHALFGSIHGSAVNLWNRKTGQLEKSFPFPYRAKDGAGFQGTSLLHGTEQLILGASEDEALYRDLAQQQSFQSLGRLPLNFESPRAYSGQGYAAYLIGPGAIQLNQFDTTGNLQR